MITRFTDKVINKREEIKSYFSTAFPSYESILKKVIEVISDGEDYETPDPERIHRIDDGDYQGTLLFVIAEKGYQPSNYWSVFVYYGSCSGCDTLQGIEMDWETDKKNAVDQLYTIALNMAQNLKSMND